MAYALSRGSSFQTAAAADEASRNVTGDKAVNPTEEGGYAVSDQALVEAPENSADQAGVRTADHPANHLAAQENEAQNAGCGLDAGNLLHPTVVACLGLLFIR